MDFFKYATGLKTCHNGIIMRHGGWANRPGTRFVGEEPVGSVKFIPFILNASLAYVLELSDKRIRFIKDGEYIYGHEMTATNTVHPTETRLHFYVGNATSNGYSAGDLVTFDGYAEGMEIVNGRTLLVDEVITDGSSNYFIVMTELDGSALTQSQITDLSEAEKLTIKRSYSIATPFLASELSEVQHVQTSDKVTLVHKSHNPKNLTRTSDTNWTLDDLVFAPSIDYPVGLNASSGPTGTEVHKYTVTAVKAETYEESILGSVTFANAKAAGSDGTAITLSNPQEIIVPSAHGFEVGDKVHVDLDAGSTIKGLENAAFTVVSTSATKIFINFDGTKYSDLGPFTYKSGDLVYPAFVARTAGDPTASSPINISWGGVTGAIEYNIYKEVNGVFGLLGVSESGNYLDVGAPPDTSITPPTGVNPFAAPGDKPGAVAYIQQRLALGNTENEPQKIITSRTAETSNFTQSRPIQDNDSIRFTIAGKQRNEINHMLDLGKLIILTSGGEWSAEGDAAGILRPTDINLRQHSYNGSNKLSPLVVDGSALYVQSRGSIIRDLGFSYQVDGYQGNDLTIFASHLFDDYTLVDWAYQQTPNSIVWAVRSDGTLLGLTLVREQQLLAWHRHSFQDGKVKAIAAIPNGTEDEVYVSIERTVNGRTVNYTERLSSRKVVDVQDSIFMDCTHTYDGRNKDTSLTMAVSQIGTNGYEAGTNMLLTASEDYFLHFSTGETNAGDQIWITSPSGEEYKLDLVSYYSLTQYIVSCDKDIPAELQTLATSNWSYAIKEIEGITHLEGENVAVFADGLVVASPKNENYTAKTVTSGKVTLTNHTAVCHIGLPYMSEVETLNIDTSQGETLSNKKMNIQHVTAFIEKSRGMWVGTKPPSDDDTDPLENLREVKIRDDEGYESPVDLKTGKVEINLKSEWNNNGRVFIRQVDPLPLSILSIFPSGHIPYR